MKHVGSFISQLAAYGVALVVTSLVASSVQADEGKATVQAVEGSAQYSVGGGAWKSLRPNMTLREGSVVKTAAGSSVDLFLKQNGPVVRVTENTTLGLDRLFFEKTGDETVIDTRLNLTEGRILGNVYKMAAASKYEVKIPSGTVGIRGTDYDISANGVVTVLTGQVNVIYIPPTGAPINLTVPAGSTFTPPATPTAQPTVAPTTPETAAAAQQQFTRVTDLVSRIDTQTGDIIVIPGETPTIRPAEQVTPIQKPLSPTTGLEGRGSGTSGGTAAPGGE